MAKEEKVDSKDQKLDKSSKKSSKSSYSKKRKQGKISLMVQPMFNQHLITQSSRLQIQMVM